MKISLFQHGFCYGFVFFIFNKLALFAILRRFGVVKVVVISLAFPDVKKKREYKSGIRENYDNPYYSM